MSRFRVSQLSRVWAIAVKSANGGKLKLECVTAASHVTSPVTSCFKINIVANINDNIFGNVCLLQHFYCRVWKCCYALRWILLHREVQSVIIRKGPKKKALLVCFYCWQWWWHTDNYDFDDDDDGDDHWAMMMMKTMVQTMMTSAMMKMSRWRWQGLPSPLPHEFLPWDMQHGEGITHTYHSLRPHIHIHIHF